MKAHPERIASWFTELGDLLQLISPPAQDQLVRIDRQAYSSIDCLVWFRSSDHWHFWTQDFQSVPKSLGSRHQVLPGTALLLQQRVPESVSSQPPEGMHPFTGAVPQI